MLVLGMHRSGTSVVTQALAGLGLDSGREPLMAATDDNPTGLYEVPRLTGLDDELLGALGGRWSAPPDATPEAVAAFARSPLGAAARSMTAEVFTEPDWVWKDPRLSLLLPFWRAVLEPEPVAVVVLRHPLEVARSLAERNGFAVDYGLALWERYTRSLLRDLEGMRAFVVEYGEAVDEPPSVIASLVAWMAETGLELEVVDESQGAAAFMPGHRRQRAGGADLSAEPTVTDEVRALHELTGGLRGPHEAFPALDLGPETPGLQLAFTEHKRLSRYEERVHELEAQAAFRDAQIADLGQEVERRSDHATAMVEGLEEERDSLAARLIELESWWPVLTAMRARRLLRRPFHRG